MVELKDHIWKVANSAKGTMRFDELRNTVLCIYFLKAIASSDTNPFTRERFFQLQRLFIVKNDVELIQDFSNLISTIESHFENLNGVFESLEIHRTLQNNTEEFGRIYKEIFEFDNPVKYNYRTVFNELIEIFSQSEGKRNYLGIFNTPPSVKKLFKAIIGDEDSVLDPACGTGSLLDAFNSDPIMHIEGQDFNKEAVAIAKLRFAFEPQVILNEGNSLSSDKLFKLKVKSVIINPPFNQMFAPETHQYYMQYGETPRSNANMLWLQLAIEHIKDDGRAMVVLSNGSLSSTGSEGRIRRAIIEDGWVEAIITLPAGLFSYTGISASIWVLSHKKRPNGKALLIDISDLGVSKSRVQSEISDEVIENISLCYKSWIAGAGITELSKYYAISLDIKDIKDNNYALTPSRYLPIEGLDEIDFTNAIELSDIITVERPRSAPELNHSLVKKISIRDLSTSIDQFQIDINALDQAEHNGRVVVFEKDVLLIAKNGDKLKPSFLSKNDKEYGLTVMNIHSFKVNEARIRIDYLIQELNKEYVKLQVSSFRTSTTIASLRVEDFLSVKIILPSLVEQEAAVKNEKEIRFQSLAILHGFENEITKLKEQQRKDLGSKKHNIMQHLNNVKSSSNTLLKMLNLNDGILKSTDIINPKSGVTVLKRFQRLGESIDNVLYYVDNLTNEMEFHKCHDINAYALVKESVEKGIHSANFTFKDSSDLETFRESEPIISVSKKDFEELYNNILENAINHGFIENENYEFRYSVLISNDKVEMSFYNNGKPFPKGMGTKEAYTTRGEKAGETANTGDGSWKVGKIAEHFNADLEIIDEPNEDFPVGIKLTFNLVQ